MIKTNEFLDMITDNLKKFLFPEEWLAIDLKLSKTELFALLYLTRKEQTTMSELADTIGVPLSTATGLVDRLVRKSYVQRVRSEEDRRIVMLALTEKGERLVDEFKDIMSRYMSRIMEGLTKEEQQQLMAIALKVFRNLQEQKEISSTDQAADTREVTHIPIE